MKRLVIKFCILISAYFCVVSCAPTVFQQIATLKSEQVTLADNGVFSSKTEEITISYNFWSDGGEFTFTIFNNTDKDIYLDLDRSYFIRNNQAYDYFQNRTFVESIDVTGNYTNSGFFSSVLSTTTASSASISTRKTNTIEFTEKKVVCIPALASKSFKEFKVASATIRECGLARDPSKKENAEKVYTAANSPLSIENRLTFIQEGKEIPIVHTFYVSSLKNIAENDVCYIHYPDKCSGEKYPLGISLNKMASSNRYFIKYTKDYIDNDRSETSLTKSQKEDTKRGRRF